MVEPAKIIRVPLECALGDAYRGALAVIGNMDGVHRGHQELIRHGVTLAQKADCPAAVVIFDPHPRQVFQPDTPPFLLTGIETKARILGELGVTWLFVLPFIEALYTQTPETFVKHTLGNIMGLKGIVTGTDFKFGAGRSGDVAALARLAGEVGMSADTIEPVLTKEGEKFSSSGIRLALQNGEPEIAAHMLGRPFVIRGKVIEGRKLARTLDFPTANVSLGDYVRPTFGVYVVSAEVDGTSHAGIANIGRRPTVDGETERLEVHLFDFDGDLYGETIDVSLLSFLRPEQKFDGLDELKAQIHKDVAAAKAWHEAHP
ncbi:bifunctional riboflavin kinase/FAD synthetase [Parvularcula marina]|uniref:bifunctional riboflavin kinase/FAD synthetase n=1 Tax=Parvularcula marina TaxID=2292771 RepID=UPI00351841CB